MARARSGTFVPIGRYAAQQGPTLDASPPLAIALPLAALPAVIAAAFTSATAAMGALSPARRQALRDALKGHQHRALQRYVRSTSLVEASWLVLRVLGLSASALLIYGVLPIRLTPWDTPLAMALAVVAYGIPAETARSIVTRNPERTAPLLLALLRPLELVVLPIAAVLVWLGGGVARVVSRPTKPAPGLTENEVEIIVNEGELDGSLDHDRSEMIRNVLDFRDLTAGEVMVPRTHVVGFELDTAPSELLKRIAKSEHSRYPVYRDRIDNIVGILHVKDLIARFAGDTAINDLKLGDLLRRPVSYVTEGQSASSVLQDMRVKRQHMALVLDEFGTVSGLVTLEDVLEEIVGDIRDEHDVDEAPIVEVGTGRVVVDASVPWTDLSRYFGTELPEGDSYNSVGGFMVARLGRVPGVGARIKDFGFEFIVRHADERHVVRVEVARANSSVPPSSSASPTSTVE
ncbi:MAG: HlyC/CorC family transporter [Polyangiaceae bacterium]|nr:HlyC/CorC family transporter [Polyangiaceae bacterium]